MAQFEYQAQCPSGSAISGVLEAADHDAAIRQLTELNLKGIELSAGTAPKPKRALGADDFIFFNEQLASLASAGVNLDEGLRQLAHDVESPKLRRVVAAIAADLQTGVPLEQAVAAHECELPVLYSRVVRAGVESGELPAVLLNLSQHMRFLRETKRIIVEAVAYPATGLAVAAAIVSFLMVLVVPMLEEVFQDFGVRLPGATLLLIQVSRIFPALAVAVGVVLVICVGTWLVTKRSPSGRRTRERLLLSLPLVGAVTRAAQISRFARSLALTVSTGIPLPDALRLAAGAAGSAALDRDANALAVHVEQGRSPSELSEKMRVIPRMFGFVVEVATGRNSLPESLFELARAYDLRASNAQTTLRAWLIPASIVCVGLAVGFCILALFLPLISLVNAVSGGCF